MEAAKLEAASLESQNQRLGDELDRLADSSSGKNSKGKGKGGASAAELADAVKG